MPKVVILTGHGAGDCMQAFQCAHYVQRKIGRDNVIVALAVRDEVFDFIHCLFGGDFDIQKWSESLGANNNIFTMDDVVEAMGYDEFYYVIPDLLFNGYKYNFDWAKYNTHPQLIKSTRVLTHHWRPSNIVYVNTNTTTPNYEYPHLRTLLKMLGEKLPTFSIYFPLITKWNGTQVETPDLTNLPSNVHIAENPSIQDSLSTLRSSCYGVFTCNGPASAAFHLGLPRLILDPQFGKLPWISRWKQDYQECIPRETNPAEVSNLIALNVTHPQTTLVSRQMMIDRPVNWQNNILLKDR